VDDDGDGQVDCADTGDCASDPACIPENCTNGVDDNGDGDIDCADADCGTTPGCISENCNNGADDDGDGQVDCADSECSVDPSCLPENCSNGTDDDGDGDVDCDDAECNGNPVCASAPEICDNGVDDNGNGQVDCAEASCASDEVCIPEICWNGTDDDGDLMADCDDPECEDSIDCQDEICWNGNDDDGDGLEDCDDDDCITAPNCNNEICDNGIDDDGDTDVDCDDAGCIDDAACAIEICDDDVDNDLDGDVDCGDSDCDGDPACTSGSEICDDGVDNDGDGQVDCNDSDCTGLPACSEDCSNDADDDGDGDVDCDDSDCIGAPGCNPEDCANDIDDDGDGDVDCGDSDCDTDTACIPEICGNGVDDDFDGLVDCDDDECAGEDPACGEVCDNLVDDDADGDVDCDDADCETDDDCEGDPGVGGTCIEQWELSCGDTDSWYNWGSGSADVIDQYSCSPWDETGREYTYVFRPEVAESVEVCLSNLNQDLDIFVISEAGGCDGNNCVSYGNNCATFDAVAGETYFLVVDGYQGALSSYDIDLTCPSSSEICDNGVDDDFDGLVDCDDDSCVGQIECTEVCYEQGYLVCGDTQYGDTWLFGTDDVDDYSCVTWLENGPEYAYYFQAPMDQANDVSISLDYDFGFVDLDLFILSDQGIPCDSEACMDYGAITAEFTTTPGAEYWVVVDGYQGDSGEYTIAVDCEPAGGEDCDNGIDDDADGDVDCDDSECALTTFCASYCESAGEISCGDTVWGDTSLTPTDENHITDQIGGYPCNVGNYDGAELAYEWVATTSGTVEFALNDPQPTVVNHDLFVLDGTNGDCVNTQCLEEGGYGFNSVEFEAVSGYTYYLVVDGFDGDVGPFSATLNCDVD
jgi:hypothetical protein